MSRKKTPAEAVVEEAVVEEMTEAVEAAPAEKTEKHEPVMYVGPTIPGIGIQNRVYTEIPAGAKEAFGKLPELRNLFLRIDQYPMAVDMLRKRNGFVYSAFTQALTLKGGNET